MPRNLLTDAACRKAKPKVKPYRRFDGEGLALWISTTGAKSWQLRYRLDGKEQTATLGKFPTLTLTEARVKADALRRLAAAGEHLTTAKRVERLRKRRNDANTFASVARDWIAREARRKKWTAKHRTQVEASIKNHLSDLDPLPVGQITAAVAAPLLRKLEVRAPLMLEKVRPRLNAILDYAVEHGMITGNPLPAVRRGGKVERRHFPAEREAVVVGEILRAARAADPCKGIQRAHLLLAFTAQRVSEVVGARWDEFALEGVEVPAGDGHRKHVDPGAGNWVIPRERMKRKDLGRGPHVVPLPPALLQTLRNWRAADGKNAIYVCPAPRDPTKSITPEGVEKFYRNVLHLAGKHSPHSWRTVFKTWCADAGKARDVSESQLDHAIGDKTESAYDRAQRIELRRALMRWYEERLLAALDGAPVVPIMRSAI